MPEDIVRELGHLTLGSRLKRIGERLQADVTRLAQSEGIDVPSPHFPLLTAVHRAGTITVGDIAAALGSAQPGVTRSLAQLEAMGLVKSARNTGDQRQRMVSLTPRGTELVIRTHRDIWPRVNNAVARLCAKLQGPLLSQLQAFEEELARLPLDRRAAKPGKGERS
jgi:DNA-binding MarR family transcriptional regulator